MNVSLIEINQSEEFTADLPSNGLKISLFLFNRIREGFFSSDILTICNSDIKIITPYFIYVSSLSPNKEVLTLRHSLICESRV